jgi:hypothetical protein
LTRFSPFCGRSAGHIPELAAPLQAGFHIRIESEPWMTLVIEASAKNMGDIVSLMTLYEADQRPSFLAGTFVSIDLQVLHTRDAMAISDEKMPPRAQIVEDRVFEFADKAEWKFSL